MRLFTAIDLVDRARAAIAEEQQRIIAALGDAAGSLRLVRSEHMHLTLVFIGEVVDARAAAIVEAMTRATPLPPFDLVFGGVGVFPSHGRPRVLWLGVLEGSPEAIALHAHVARQLTAVGVMVEDRPFRPHLTLARWKDSRRSTRPRLPESASAVAKTRVEAVTLYQSRVSSAGPSYTPLAHARLT
jgi:2'-5' RNA ligase